MAVRPVVHYETNEAELRQFLAVWVPFCTSDIVFPLLFRDRRGEAGAR